MCQTMGLQRRQVVPTMHDKTRTHSLRCVLFNQFSDALCLLVLHYQGQARPTAFWVSISWPSKMAKQDQLFAAFWPYWPYIIKDDFPLVSLGYPRTKVSNCQKELNLH